MIGSEILEEVLRRLFHQLNPISPISFSFPSEQSFLAMIVYGFAAFIIYRHIVPKWIGVIAIFLSSAVCLFSGIGIISIPGFNFLKEIGWPLATFIGFDFGLMFGAVGTIVYTLVVKDKQVEKKRHGGNKYLVIVNGPLKEVEIAENILHTEGIHLNAVA